MNHQPSQHEIMGALCVGFLFGWSIHWLYLKIKGIKDDE